MFVVQEAGSGACVVVGIHAPFQYTVLVPDAELRVRPEMHPFVPL